MLTFSTAPTRIFLIALFLIGTIFAALPASGLAHDGHIHDEEAAALQAAFDEELTEAPREVRGECVDTVEFEDLGDGCRTASGLLRLELADGTSMTTHGPDFESPTSATAATMPPRMVAAIRTASADDIFCAPVGTFRFQLTYAIPADGIDDYAVGAERLRRSTYELSAVLDNESRSLTPTASRKLRVACGVDGIPSVLRLRLPTRTTEATVNNAFPEILAGAGDARGTGRTHYLTYYDDHLGDFGGIADMYLDARPSSSNNNLSGGMVAVMDNSEGYGVEWKTLLHEAIHTMGGVQNSAPDASGASHCVDGIDVMCYNDGGPNAHLFNTDQCPQMQVDCGHDSYFHPTPDTPWLQDNWNVAAPANGYLQGATVTGDVTAPSVPTGLAATGSFGLFVRLAWNPSTDAGSGTYGYRVYRSTGAGAWTILGDTWPGSVTYDAATLGYGVNYDFAVAAYDARGNESEKAVVLANSGGPTGVPRVTDGPAPAPATDLVVTGRTADSISLSWNRSGAGSTHTARVCRSGDTFFCPAAMRSFTWAGLPAGSLETFSVQTFDSDGRASVAATVTARTLGGADVIPPTAPTIVTVDPSSDPMSPILSWSGAGGDTHDYAIYHESAPGTWDMGNVQHTNLTTLAVRGMLYLAGTQRVGVAAVDEAGNHSAITSVDHLTVAQRDRTSPSAPTSISISDKTPTSFTASWSASSDASGIRGYRIEVATPQDLRFMPLLETASLTGTVTGLTPSSTYYVQVTAVDNAGWTTPSVNAYVVTTPADTVAPTTPSPLITSNLTHQSVDLAWSVSTDFVGLASYEVSRVGVGVIGTVAAGAPRTFSAAGLTQGTPYTFQVVAIDTSGNRSTPATATVTTLDIVAPSPATSFQASAVTSTTAALSWTAGSDNVLVSNYSILRTTPGPELELANVAGSATSTTLSGLTDLTSYTVVIEALDAAGNASTRASVSFATPDGTPPTVPGTLSASANTTGSNLTLNWGASTDVSGIASYEVTRDGAGVIGTTASGVITRAITGLAEATSYTFHVVAIDPAGNRSAPRTLTVATPDVTAPDNVDDLRITDVAATTANLRWSAATDNVGVVSYKVWRTTPGPEELLNTVAAPATLLGLTGLTTLTSYGYAVEAVDAAGNTASRSTISITTGDGIAPTMPSAAAASAVGTTGLTLNWGASTDASGIANYEVSRDGTGVIATPSSATLTLPVSGLLEATAYTFRIVAIDTSGARSAEATVVVSTIDVTAPVAVGNFRTTTLAPTTATLAWDAATDNASIANYRLARTAPTAGTPELVSGSTLSHALTSLSDSTSYTWQITALDPTGLESAVRTVTFATPDGTSPIAPTGPVISANTTGSSLTISWTESTDAVGVSAYEVTRVGAGVIATVPGGQTSYNATGLTQGVTYEFRIVARDAAGNRSGAAAASVFATVPDVTAPTFATAVTASGIGNTTATLNWNAATDNVAVAGYRIWRTAPGAELLIGDAPFPAAGVTLSPLAEGTAFTFQVAAVDAAGNISTRRSVSFATPDHTAPIAPGTPVVSQNTTGSSVRLTWAPSTDAVGVVEYEIFRDGNYLTSVSGATTTYLATNLLPSVSYEFRIVARDLANNRSAPNASSVIATVADVSPPSIVSTIGVTSTSASTATLTWSGATDNVGVASYNVWRTLPGPDFSLGSVTHPTNSLALTGLTEGTMYAFDVQTVDASGNLSARRTVFFTAPDVTAPTAPGSLVATNGTTGTSLTLGWTASFDARGVSSYEISRNGTVVGSVSGGVLSYAATGLSPSITYTFTVVAIDNAGHRSAAATVEASTADTTPPGTITNFRTTALAERTATLAWNTGSDNVGVVSYRIYRTAPGATELLPAVTSPTISKPLTGLIEGTSYEFEIEAVDAAGLTSPRATLSFTTLDTTDPSAPGTPVVTNLAGHSLTLTWSASTDPTGIAGYRIRNFFTNTDSTTAGNVTTIDLTGLSDARQYTFGVYAIDSNDNESAVASVTTTTPDVTAPASITGFNVATIGASTATLAWNHSPDNATSSTYKIYRVDGGVSTQVATSIFSTVDLTGLAEGNTYTWEIDATDTAGNATARVSVSGRTGDATAPTAPGAPVVSANTGTSLTLTWSAATDAVGVTVYEIRQNGDVVGTVDGATLTYTITSGLIQGYSPSFRISAVDAANHRTFGAPTVATIPDTTSPLAVGNVRMMSINTTTATIMWNTTTDNVGVTNYNVFAVAGGIPTLVGTVGPTTTSLALSGLTEATEYTYRVIAGDFATNMSTPTEIAFSTVMSAPPTAPPFVFSSNVTGTGVDLTWTANGSGILEFDIFQDGDLIATISGADRSYVVTGLTDKTNYVFGVVTVDGIGRRSDPTTANVSTPDVSPPSTVTGFGATGVGPTWVNLSWNTSTDKTSVQRYTVWRLDAGGDVLVAEINAPGATNTTASNLDDSTGYTFAVEARDPFGNTTVRTLVTATTSDGTAPTAPGTPVVSALTHNSLNLTWDASTDLSAFTYEVSRNGASPVTGLTATTFAVTGLNPNADYTFTVRARDAANNLSSASTVSVTTPAAPDTTAPSSAYIYTQSVDGVNVTLAWLTANDNVAVTEYRVRRTAPTGGTAVVVPASSPRSLALPGLSDLVDYTYEIVAVDAANNISSAETVSFRTPDTSPPTTPGTPAVSNLQPRSLRLTWTASTDAGGVSYYFVTPSTFIGLDGMVWAPNTSLLVPNLQPDTDYTFTVKAYDPNGFVSPTSTVTVRTPVEPDTTPPGSPSNARTAAIGHTTATLAWSAPALVEGVTQYRISRTAPSAGTVEFAAAPATSFAVSGLTELTTYSYELVALDAAGNASLPQTITFRTTGDDTVVPTLPGPLSLGEYDGTVYVSWSTAGDNDEVAGYRVSVNGGAEEVLNNYWNTNHQVYGLSRDATHTVSVVAIDTAGNRSAALTGTIYIPAAYVAPPEPPVDPTPPPGPQPTPPPAAPSGVVAALTATTARISWNASSGASSYRVSVAGQARIVTGTSADFGPFAPKTVLAISVTAIGDGGESGAASLTVSTLADKVAPTAPGKLKAVSKKAKTLTLTWLPSKDDVKLLRYELQLTAKGAKAIKLKLAASAKTTTVAKLKSKAAYKMQLRAIDAAGNASKWVTVTAKPK